MAENDTPDSGKSDTAPGADPKPSRIRRIVEAFVGTDGPCHPAVTKVLEDRQKKPGEDEKGR